MDNFERDDERFENYYQRAIEFIQEQYINCNQNRHQLVFVHVATMGDADCLQKVLWDTQNIMLRSNFRYGS